MSRKPRQFGVLVALGLACVLIAGCKRKPVKTEVKTRPAKTRKTEPLAKVDPNKKTDKPPVKKADTPVKKTKSVVKVGKKKKRRTKGKTGKKTADPVKAAIERLAELEAVTEKNISGEISKIDFQGTDVADADLALLKHFPYVTVVNLSGTRITDAGLKHLTVLPRLRELYLFNVGIGDKGLAQLKDSTDLEVVCLDGTKITGAGLKHLKDWEILRTLHIHSRNKMTDAGLDQIAHLTSLRELKVGPGISKARVRAWKKAMPRCRVKHITGP
ncbi:MAG: hypothetical protein ACE5KM_14005 [Planctomycetaceae bacterium]